MKSEICQRIERLRQWMRASGYDACVIVHANPHLGEYIEPHYQARRWFSGFTGSAGTLVVTADAAGLWTDSRYYLQAGFQLEGTGIGLMRQEEAPAIDRWLCRCTQGRPRVAMDASLVAAHVWQTWSQTLQLYDDGSYWNLWTDRPLPENGPAFVHPMQWAGETAADKLQRLHAWMRSQCAGPSVLVAGCLDEIAWLLNLRGHDLDDSPLLRAYLVVQSRPEGWSARLFAAPEALGTEVRSYLNDLQVGWSNYSEFESGLALGDSRPTALCDGACLTWRVWSALRAAGCVVQQCQSPLAGWKSVKNETELAGIRAAMVKDGVMWVRFLREFVQRAGDGRDWTESYVVERLRQLKASQPDFWGESFSTIAAYAGHGAVVHYAVTPETDCRIGDSSLLLVDTGTQYLHGTTDMTRTLACGRLTKEERRDYTLVMKSHIALARAVFPEGTPASAVDGIARQPLWREAVDFKHGTGHGVGAFLNVHEGPVRVSPASRMCLAPGMVTSDEPGLYRESEHGVRIENLLEVVPYKSTGFGRFLQFNVLTLCPMDLRPLLPELLDAGEKAWLNAYHLRVRNALAPYLTEEENQWLTHYAYEI
ncbi:MAG: aminopeptidase P family protein [Paludibacteraceae bacterium]|nr:aminopeptidase P family protein [Paludibacteraceae bacterium]